MAARSIMPKRRRDNWDAEDAMIRGSVYQWIGETRFTVEDLAEKIGMPRSSLYRRLKEPGTFRVDELRKIRSVIGEVRGI